MFPRHYYKNITSGSKKIYTRNGQGAFDVDRLVAGKPAFYSAGQNPVEKKLIFADWTAKTWRGKNRNIRYALLEMLLLNQFEILILNLDDKYQAKFRPFTLQDLQHIKIEKAEDIPILEHDEIATVTRNHFGWASDTFLILDHHELNALGEFKAKKIIKNISESSSRLTLDFQCFEGYAHQSKIIHISRFLKSKRGFTKLQHSVFSKKTNLQFKAVIEALPHINFDHEFTEAMLTHQQYDTLMRKGHITVDNITFTQNDLLDLEKLHIVGDIDEETKDEYYANSSTSPLKPIKLENLLAIATNLIELHISKNVPTTCKHYAALPPSSIKSFSLCDCDVSPEMIMGIKHLMPKLSALFLGGNKSTIIAENNLSDAEPFKKLALLSIEKATISTQSMKNLLLASDQLSNIHLSDHSIIEPHFFKDINLSKVTRLALSNCKITIENFVTLLNKCTELTDFIINDSLTFTGNNVDNNSVAVNENLISLACKAPIPTHILKILVRYSPNLQGALFEALDFTRENTALFCQWKNLLELVLDDCELPPELFGQLLKTSSQLKKLKLENIVLEGSPDVPNMDNLADICISNSEIETRFLYNLTQKATMLKKLIVHECGLQSVNTAIPAEFHLPNLRDLTYAPTLVDVVLKKITEASPQLKHLTIEGKSNASLISFIKKLTKLSSLTIIDDSQTASAISIDLPNTVIISPGLTSPIIGSPKPNNTPKKSKSPRTPSTPLKRAAQITFFRQQHKKESFFQLSLPPENVKFVYNRKDFSLNQDMLIHQCNQYMALTNLNVSYIPYMQAGICEYVTHLFLTMPDESWQTTVLMARQWDGSLQNLSPALETLFKKMANRNSHIEVTKKVNHLNRYIGKDIDSFFVGRIGKFYISNPWHTIGVKRESYADEWMVLDPNAKNGVELIETPQLPNVIREILGPVISIYDDQTNLRSHIENPNEFLAEGGLLLFDHDCNNIEAEHLKNQAEFLMSLTFSQAALKGILLQDYEGAAWVLGINSDKPYFQELTIVLLTYFIEAYPQDYVNLLQKSVSNLTAFQRHHTYENIIKLFKMGNKQSELLDNFRIALLQNEMSEKLKPTINSFKTWSPSVAAVANKHEFCQLVVSGKQNKILIETNSRAQQDNFSIALQAHCASISRSYLYIDNADQLNCVGNFLTRVGRQGRLMKGPGGVVFNFIREARAHRQPCVMVINFRDFNAGDIVSTNTVIDKIRHVDGIPLPDNIIVVGITDTSSANAYRESDFYSRFNDIYDLPISAPALASGVKTIPPKSTSHSQTFVIDFFKSDFWQSRLLGSWMINKKMLNLEVGQLECALASGKVIELRNGPWNDEFTYFWQQALTLGKIKNAYGEWDISNTRFVHSNGYDWSSLLLNVTCDDQLQADAFVLNSSYLSHFYKTKIYDAEALTVDMIPGIIYNRQNAKLAVNVMGAISEDEWAEFLHVCSQQNVTLELHFASNVNFPLIFTDNGQILKQNTISTNPFVDQRHTFIISTNDCEGAFAVILPKDQNWLLINVDAMEVADMLIRTHHEADTEEGFIKFRQQKGVLLEALENDQNVALYGHFRAEQADCLMQLLIERLTVNDCSGKLCLFVKTPCQLFNALPVTIFEPSEDNKKSYLKEKFNADLVDHVTKDLENVPLAKMLTLVSSAARLPSGEALENPWLGFQKAPVNARKSISSLVLDRESAAIAANEFINKQFDKMYSILKDQPTVYLGGDNFQLKKILIEKLLTCYNTTVYEGADEFKTFLTDQSDACKIFVVTNASDFPVAIFNDMHLDSPHIVYEGIVYPCRNHKVILIGDATLQSQHTAISSLFELHGNSILVSEFSLEYIYAYFILPLFENCVAEVETYLAAKLFMTLYCQSNITISSLQMIALLATKNIEKNPHRTLLQAIFYYIKQLEPKLYHSERFKQLAASDYAFVTAIPQTYKVETIGDYIVLPSRTSTCDLIDDLISLHEARFSENNTMNEQQLFGGQSGLIIEGEPGIGKSEMVIAKLVQRGYREIHLSAAMNGDKTFIRVPANMPKIEKDNIKLAATKNGVIMLFDEYNSTDDITDPLVNCISGKRLNGLRPTNAGTLSFIMQNDKSLAGRAALNKDLEEQLIRVDLAPYSCAELVKFLKWRGVDAVMAKVAAEAFIAHVDYAKQHKLTPAPSFRNFVSCVKPLLTMTAEVKNQELPEVNAKRARK